MVTEAARLKVWEPYRNENCTLCPLHRSAQSVCLMGDGPVPCKVMLIGEAPGFREDEIQKPFAGKAGQYLDHILAEVGLPRESVFITNAAKCRPPDNRTPTRPEIKSCSTYLQNELATVRPEFVVPLGNAALEATLGVKGIMKKRGAVTVWKPQFFGAPLHGYKVLPTLHPAAILRNQGWEEMFKADLLKLARLVRGDDKKLETKTRLISNSKSLRKLTDLIADVETPIAFDVETWGPSEEGGLRTWDPQGGIGTVSFTWEPGQSYVVVLEHAEAKWDIPITLVYAALAVAFEGKKMVAHNAKFDMAWMRVKGVKLESSFDTLLAAHLLDENRPNGLKPLARTLLGADEWDIDTGDVYNSPLMRLATYNGKDTDYTLRIYHILREQLKERPRLLRLFKLLVMPACNAFVDIEANGFPVDFVRLKDRHEFILEKIEGIRQELMAYVPKALRSGANFRSHNFLGAFLFGHLELPILVTTPKTGKPSTAEAVLLQLKNKHPVVGLLMDLRKWMKYESTYTRNWLARVRSISKPRLYTSYKLSGTVTGRLSGNMQQVPREILIRSIIGIAENSNAKRESAGKPRKRFVEADFSQIELRIAAMFSRDPALNKAFNTGGDPHYETAMKILGRRKEDISKEERKMAKAVNFGFLYGMAAKKFRKYADEKYQTKISLEEAQEYRTAFFQQYKGLLPWHERQRRMVRNFGYVVSPIGRVRHLPQIMSTDEYLQAQAEREAINAPVQGLASDLTVLSMVLLSQELDNHRAKIIGNVHDSILFEIDDDYIEEALRLIKHKMENLPLQRYFGFKPSVPIEVEIKVSDHWGE